jgi:hypothetical protein
MEKENTSVHTLQPLQPDPALRRLDVLAGRWELRGRTLDTAEDDITGWVNFEWLPGGFFLQADGNTLSGGWRPQEGSEGSPESTYDAVMTRVNGKEKP